MATKPRTIVYVDGFNLYYGAVKGTPHKWLNLEKFFRMVRPLDDVLRIPVHREHSFRFNVNTDSGHREHGFRPS